MQAQAQAQASQVMSINGTRWFIPAESLLKPCEECKDDIGIKVICPAKHVICQSCYEHFSQPRVKLCKPCRTQELNSDHKLHDRDIVETDSKDLKTALEMTKFGCSMTNCGWTGLYNERNQHLKGCKSMRLYERQWIGMNTYSEYSERNVICDSCQSPYIAKESESHISNCPLDKPILYKRGVTLNRQLDSVGPFYQEKNTDTTKRYSEVYIATTASHLKFLCSPGLRILPENAQCTLGGEPYKVEESRTLSSDHRGLNWCFKFTNKNNRTHYSNHFDEFEMSLYLGPDFLSGYLFHDASSHGMHHIFSGEASLPVGIGLDLMKKFESLPPDCLCLLEIINST